MFLKYSQTSGIYRLYESDEDGYENREDYIGVSSVNWISDDDVYLYGAVVLDNKGSIGFMMILNDLIDRGAKTVKISRARNKILPFGKVIQEYDNERLWEIDLTNEEIVNRIRKINGKF